MISSSSNGVTASLHSLTELDRVGTSASGRSSPILLDYCQKPTSAVAELRGRSSRSNFNAEQNSHV